jgi:hypothetical protein
MGAIGAIGAIEAMVRQERGWSALEVSDRPEAMGD